MDVHVRVDLDDDGPVVVKSATAAGAERLRHERARLESAVHPGVVTLAGRAGHGGAELRTLFAGEPVARWSGPVTRVAGLGAAVASTLADLHDLGIVHGRIDATHILIGDDGRLRLCGFSHPGDADPSDDVAALGAVLGELLERARPERRRRLPRLREGGSRRGLRAVIEHATDPVPSRRPPARALADAILREVPAAALPAGVGDGIGHGVGGTDPVGRVGGAPADLRPGAREPDTLDRIWAFAGEPSDDERWAAALGTGPPDLVLRDRDDPPLPLAPVDTPRWPERRDHPVDDRDDSHHDDLHDGAPYDEDPHDGAPHGDDPYDDDPHDRAPHAGDPHAGDPHEVEPYDGDPYDDDSHDRHDPTGDLQRRDVLDRHGATHRAVGEVDDLTRDHRAAPGRVAVGARPIAKPAGATAQRRRNLVLAAVAVMVTAVAGGGALILGTGGGADTPRPDDTATAPTSDCPPVAPPAADVDGDGCPEHLAVDGTTIDAGVARWSLGEPGDLVAVGSWHCDGQASAALLRPSTGDVFFFSGWADEGEPVTVGASRRVVGAVGIRADPDSDGCDRLLVDLEAGGSGPVEVPR